MSPVHKYGNVLLVGSLDDLLNYWNMTEPIAADTGTGTGSNTDTDTGTDTDSTTDDTAGDNESGFDWGRLLLIAGIVAGLIVGGSVGLWFYFRNQKNEQMTKRFNDIS